MKRFILYCLTAVFAYQANAQFSGKGSGTEEDPYLVETALNVEEIRNFPKKSAVAFKLINDIDMREFIEGAYGTAGWNPISDFYGTLDGDGHVISGLFINRSSEERVGFFRNLNNASIKNIILEYNGDIKGSFAQGALVGGLCAFSKDSNFFRCGIKGRNISGRSAGGLIGEYDSSDSYQLYNISECFVECNEISGTNYCGGLVAKHHGAVIINNNRVCVNKIKSEDTYTGNGTGTGYIGGIVGSAYMSVIGTYSVSNGTLKFNMFEGQMYCNKVDDSFVGGIGGYLLSSTEVHSNVAICDSIVSKFYIPYIGRIAGSGGSTNCLIDPTSVNANRAYNQTVLNIKGNCNYATDSKLNGMGVGNYLLKSRSMYEGMGWDMENVWTIEEGETYPRLIWEVEKELNKSPLSITNNNVEVEDNAILNFDAEKVTTNVGGGITYTYYQCVPDEPVISNYSSSVQPVTVTISSEDYSHLKWAGIDGKNADMMDVSETRSCQLGKGESIPLKLHAVFADQDYGSYMATVKVSCNNYTRTFQIRFLYENPDWPICPTPDINYVDGTLAFSCGAEGKPEYHVSITNPDANTYIVDNELKLDRIYNIEVYATAEGYLASETAKLVLCWIDSKIIDKDDNSIKEECLPIQIRKNNGTITIAGIAKNTFVSAYSLSGTLLDSTISQAELVTLNLPNSVDVFILKIGDKSIKITF